MLFLALGFHFLNQEINNINFLKCQMKYIRYLKIFKEEMVAVFLLSKKNDN